jgi:hypothetical protein
MRKNQHGPILTIYIMTLGKKKKTDTWHKQKLPCGILIKLLGKNLLT